LISTARLRRAVRRETVGVDVLAALSVVGAVLKYLSVAFLFPVVVALWYGETPVPFFVAGLAGAVGGWVLERLTRGKERIGAREGFLIVAVTWLGAAALGAIPYMLSGADQISHPVDAYFEAMSGFTTTGASVLTDIPALSRSMLMWRQFSQWLGGMGIIVLALAVLPRLRVGGRQLFASEAPGPEVENLATTVRNTARRLWLLYIVLTALMIAILASFAEWGIDDKMTLYDAIAHPLTTLPTGGFSPRARNFEEFGAASQWTATAFMFIAGANFALLYAALIKRRAGPLARDHEFRLYVAILIMATAGLTAILAGDDLFESEAAIRHAAFQVTTTMTTTGYASTDFATWPFLAAVALVGLMFIGGCAGSTSGSIKVVRHLLVGRALRRDLDQTIHPELISVIRLNRMVVEEKTLRAVVSFVLLYAGIFTLGTLALLIDAQATGLQLTPFQAIAAAATTLGNVGPGFGFAGPMGSFEPFGDMSKVSMIMLMWLGRLEIIPVVVLLTKGYWRA
jgi:trk system potassium uptake protein TrkH